MSLLLQIALGALIAGGIGFGVWNHNHHENMTQQPSTTTQDQTATHIDAQAGVNLSAGTTDADLDADMSSIDNQLKLVNESSVESDQSMSDKPITQ